MTQNSSSLGMVSTIEYTELPNNSIETSTVTVTDYSVADAPASVYASPNSTVAGLAPSIVITGGTLSL